MSAMNHPDRVTRTRLVVRHVSELLLARAERWTSCCGVDRLSAMIFGVVFGAGIAHLPLRDPATGHWIDVEAAAALGRPVSSAAVSQSMGIPQTTVRRHAAHMAVSGLLQRTSRGFTIGPDVFADRGLGRLAGEDADDLRRTLLSLADAGFAFARIAAAATEAVPAGVVERLLIVFELRALETFARLYGDITAGTISAAIVAANVRQITRDPVLAHRYGSEDVPPPDQLRRPVRLRGLARDVDLPFETVRRRVSRLADAGLIEWKSDGVIVPTRVLDSEPHRRNNRRIVGHFERMVEALAGLEFSTPG